MSVLILLNSCDDITGLKITIPLSGKTTIEFDSLSCKPSDDGWQTFECSDTFRAEDFEDTLNQLGYPLDLNKATRLKILSIDFKSAESGKQNIELFSQDKPGGIACFKLELKSAQDSRWTDLGSYTLYNVYQKDSTQNVRYNYQPGEYKNLMNYLKDKWFMVRVKYILTNNIRVRQKVDLNINYEYQTNG